MVGCPGKFCGEGLVFLVGGFKDFLGSALQHSLIVAPTWGDDEIELICFKLVGNHQLVVVYVQPKYLLKMTYILDSYVFFGNASNTNSVFIVFDFFFT